MTVLAVVVAVLGPAVSAIPLDGLVLPVLVAAYCVWMTHLLSQ